MGAVTHTNAHQKQVINRLVVNPAAEAAIAAELVLAVSAQAVMPTRAQQGLTNAAAQPMAAQVSPPVNLGPITLGPKSRLRYLAMLAGKIGQGLVASKMLVATLAKRARALP